MLGLEDIVFGANVLAEHLRKTRLLGKRVRVKLAEDKITEGIFLAFGDEGTFEIEEDDGFVHYCWPLLDIEEAT